MSFVHFEWLLEITFKIIKWIEFVFLFFYVARATTSQSKFEYIDGKHKHCRNTRFDHIQTKISKAMKKKQNWLRKKSAAIQSKSVARKSR